jgi:homoserine acetyltransferase
MTNEFEVESAFIVFKRPDGSFFATTDLSTVATVTKTATIFDVKTGCQEMLDAIKTDILVSAVKEAMAPLPTPQEKVASSIRTRLQQEGIL